MLILDPFRLTGCSSFMVYLTVTSFDGHQILLLWCQGCHNHLYHLAAVLPLSLSAPTTNNSSTRRSQSCSMILLFTGRLKVVQSISSTDHNQDRLP